MGYFLDFVYSHEKTNRNLIDKFKCIIQWNTKISSLSLSLSLSSLSSKNSLKKIKGEIKTKKQRTNSDIYLRKLTNWRICQRTLCVCHKFYNRDGSTNHRPSNRLISICKIWRPLIGRWPAARRLLRSYWSNRRP